MNYLITKDYLNQYEAEMHEILAIENPFHEKRIDARMKWVGVMVAYKELQLNADSLLDLGCGPSSLPLYFKKTVPNVTAIDCNVPGTVGLFQENGVQFVHSTVEEATFAPDSVDVIVDSCAVGCSMNVDKVLSNVHSWLKPGGYLISNGDSCLEQNQIPFPSPSYWIEAANRNGLELVGEIKQQDLDEAYSFQYGPYKLFISRLIFRKPLQG